MSLYYPTLIFLNRTPESGVHFICYRELVLCGGGGRDGAKCDEN